MKFACFNLQKRVPIKCFLFVFTFAVKDLCYHIEIICILFWNIIQHWMCIKHAKEALCKLQGSSKSCVFKVVYLHQYLQNKTRNQKQNCYDSIKPNVRLSHPIDLRTQNWSHGSNQTHINLIDWHLWHRWPNTHSPTIWTYEIIFVIESGVKNCKKFYKTRKPPKSWQGLDFKV